MLEHARARAPARIRSVAGHIRCVTGRIRCVTGRSRGVARLIRCVARRICGVAGRIRSVAGRIRGVAGRIRSVAGRICLFLKKTGKCPYGNVTDLPPLEPSSSRLRCEAGPAAPSPGGRQFRQERWEGPYKMPCSVIASQSIFSLSGKSTASGILLCEIDFGRFGVARGGPKMKILQKRQSSKGVFEGFVHFLNS